MKKEMLVIVPTKGRPHKILEFYDLFLKNSEISDLCLGIDEDEIDIYPKNLNAIYDINPNMRLVPKLNTIAMKYVDDYKYICFMGDDVRTKTKGWDTILTEPLRDNIAISYGNDQHNGIRLPNTIVVNSEFIKALGWMVPPVTNHYFMDNFYLDTGVELDILHYFPDVDLEHLHHWVGKAEMDSTYIEGGSISEDGVKYIKYKQSTWQEDVNKIREIIKK